MKKLILGIALLVLVLSVVACAVNVDYDRVDAFEADLNNGVDVVGKSVRITVEKLVPDSAFGYNIQAGAHLNFCSSTNPDVEEGDEIVVRVLSIRSKMFDSYIIDYKIIER